jgi:GDP-L-fucose synthase
MNTFDLAGKRVWVAGHRGMVGSALVRRLEREACEIVTATRQELDLRRQSDVEDWMRLTKPDAVFVASATVGGIKANMTRPAEFLYDNLILEANIIHGAHLTGVKKLMFLASSCIYPRAAPQPMNEDSILTGALEPTNEAYSVAKLAGIKMCEFYRRQYGCDFISALPTNLYGLNDNFDPDGSHVIPGLIVRTHEAKLRRPASLTIWGSGNPRREFLHVDDAADACVYIFERYSDAGPINIGTGSDVSVRELATMIAETVGYTGPIDYDRDKPDGMPVKRLDIARLTALGWQATIPLREGLVDTYDWFLSQAEIRGART